ncbi:hypothetical protein TIFTF001_040613 [Ficus carica]|uniref:Protein kinase domain-containing protein n=1 Tax=Ficus carica TaxID=3494 RepID=A0AA87YWL5_FICCA|nr:hypothetical protein TIFTF001_040609 [Ficus carica]GMN24745.1 hypothetical protein TIFTF001_040613 [Ficus carica]
MNSLHILKTVFVSISCNVPAKNLSVLWTYFEKYCNDVPKSSNISTNSPYYRFLSCVIDLMEVLPEWATLGIRRQKARTRGLSGLVYEGTLNDMAGGCIVAVKRIFGESEQSERIFINEAKIISRLIHRNLVKFVGWCHEQRDEFLLVYEFMLNGSLDAHRFGNRRTLLRDVRDTDFSTKFGDVEDSDDGVGGDFWLLGAG